MGILFLAGPRGMMLSQDYPTNHILQICIIVLLNDQSNIHTLIISDSIIVFIIICIYLPSGVFCPVIFRLFAWLLVVVLLSQLELPTLFKDVPSLPPSAPLSS